MSRAPLCKDKHPDGRVCALYLDHYGDHKENHLRSSWSSTMKEEQLEVLRESFEHFIFMRRHTAIIDIAVALDPYKLTKEEVIKFLESEFPDQVEHRAHNDTHLQFSIFHHGRISNV